MKPPVRRSPRFPVPLVFATALLAILVGCKASRSEPSSTAGSGNPPPGNPAVPLAAEPEHFRFVVPPAYLPHELRGEGSEKLLAPADAQIQTGESGIRVESGTDFALEIQFQPRLTALPAAVEGAQRVASESDVVVFQSGDGYWFLVLRELVPEWDENARRRVACGSAGALAARTGPDRRFSRAAVERMVGACRSLELPRLE